MRMSALLSLGAGLIATTPLAAQRADTSYFITRLGTDTLAVERLVRTPTRAIIDGVSRSPKTRVRQMVIQFDQNGEFAGLESTLRAGDGPVNAAPLERVTTAFVGDSIVWTMSSTAAPRTTRTARPPHAVPGTGPFVSGYQLLADMALRHPADSVAVNLLAMNTVTKRSFKKLPDGRYTFGDGGGGPIQAVLDDKGRLKRYLAIGSELGMISEAASRFDIEQIARRYADLDARGKGFGELSPRDTARANFGGSQFTVDYGSPRKRGRMVLGGLVPWGEVWRTGAGAVTTFETSADLMVGAVHVPAGKYVLNVLAGKAGWSLVVGKFVSQGAYDPKQDMGRTPMSLRKLSAPVEAFTITVTGKAKEGMLTMRWDTTEASVPIIVH